MSVRISAIICTLNRIEYLRKAIKSLVEQTLPKECYEILIVDNGSTDGTSNVALKEFSYVPNLRYLYEPVLGLSRARNTGWQGAIGEYVAYLDDDAIASSNWLEMILSVFETVESQTGCVGGRVVPIWKARRTPWLPAEMLSYLSIVNPSDKPLKLEDSRNIAGTNIAFPKKILDAMGGFQTDLGRKGGKLLSNEEILLRRQLEKKDIVVFTILKSSFGIMCQPAA
jgi:glycosyltransferase involved in cell wall biosynthesis